MEHLLFKLFLNRLLGLALADQALLLHLFNFLLARAGRRGRAARRSDDADDGVDCWGDGVGAVDGDFGRWVTGLVPALLRAPRDAKAPVRTSPKLRTRQHGSLFLYKATSLPTLTKV